MKAKVVIENSTASIILDPENELEEFVMEKLYDNKAKFMTTIQDVAGYSRMYFSPEKKLQISILVLDNKHCTDETDSTINTPDSSIQSDGSGKV